MSAVLYSGAQTYACRIGRSPKYELLRSVHEDAELKRCLELAPVSGLLELTLLVDGEGHVDLERFDGDEAEEPPPELERCAARLRGLHAMRLGCRWRVQVMLGSYSL